MTDSNENPDEEFLCRKFDLGMALLGREANEAAHESEIMGPDETSESLRGYGPGIVRVPAYCSGVKERERAV